MHLHLPHLIFADIYNPTRSRLAQGGRTRHSTKEMQILWRSICPWFQFDTSCTTQTWKIIRPIGQEELLICSVPYMQTNVLQDKYKQTYPNQTPGKNQPSVFWKTWYFWSRPLQYCRSDNIFSYYRVKNRLSVRFVSKDLLQNATWSTMSGSTNKFDQDHSNVSFVGRHTFDKTC